MKYLLIMVLFVGCGAHTYDCVDKEVLTENCSEESKKKGDCLETGYIQKDCKEISILGG